MTMRKIGGFFAGLGAAVVIVIVFEMVGMVLHPVTPPPDASDRAAMLAMIESLPLWVLLTVALGHAVASFAGVVVASRVGRSIQPAMAFFVAFSLSTLLNLAMVPHPGWFWIVDLVGVAATAFVAFRLETPRWAT
jgi:hypothetical protein